jgi:ABC-type Fe3+/spermidine/putrescine transport system ATPase subunit
MPTDVVIDGVTKRYSGSADSGGIFDVTAAIEGGRFTTLLGESGSGKTTLLRLLAGFLRPDAGSITMGERRVAGGGVFVPTQERDLAMVFQSYALWPHMSVFDNVAFGLRAQKTSRQETGERVRATLALVGLEGFERRRPAELSGGQQQRVALARSLVLEPSLLLLDEPLSNLDADLRVQMRDQLKSLQLRTGITFVYVTHDQEEAFALSDHMIVLDHGRILQQGDCQEIYRRPRSTKVAEFMGRRGLHLDGAVQADSSFRTAPPAASLGTFPHVDDRLAGGGDATLVVHSEDLVVCRPDAVPEAMVSVPGTVEAVSFAGREHHVVVVTETQRRATAYAPMTSSWTPGQPVVLGFRREDAWLFPRTEDVIPSPPPATAPAAPDLAEATNNA